MFGKDPSLTISATDFAFVMNVEKLERASFALAPGHELRRANAEETSIIQRKIRQLASNSEYMGGWPRFRELLCELTWETVAPHWRVYQIFGFIGTAEAVP